MQFLETEIKDVTLSVWDTMLAMKIEESDDSIQFDETQRTMSACVQIAGDWLGSTIITCTSSLAMKIACSMFEMEEEEVDEELIHDAWGEVANMVGGNIKGLIPGSNQLSLPTVADGIAQNICVPGSEAVTKLHFISEGEKVQVLLLKAEGKSADEDSKAQKHESIPAGIA